MQSSIDAYDTNTNKITTTTIQGIIKRKAWLYYKITTSKDSIICTGTQLFYDAHDRKWIPAHRLSTKTIFLNSSLQMVACVNVEKVTADKSLNFYTLSLERPHTYFVSKDRILTHNVFPIAIGLTFAIGDGLALTGAGVGLGSLGIGLWQKWNNQKELKFAQIDNEVSQACHGGAPQDPNDRDGNKVNNMEEFFKTSFGKKIEKSLEKTNKRYQGQTIYKVNEKIPECGLRKGDQLYLDNLHKDHLEVFNRNNKLKTILNLDGTENLIKLAKSAGRKI